MLAFIARSLTGHNGADLLAGDILDGLAASGQVVSVVTDDARLAAARSAGVSTTRWLEAPKLVPFPASMRHRKTTRALARWAKWGVLDMRHRRALRHLSPALTLVNAFGSHRETIVRTVRGNGPAALIVHESPRHFGGPHQPVALQSALRILASYTHLIFVSSRCRDEWLAFPELAAKPAYHVPNCCREADVARVQLEAREAVRARLGIPRDGYAATCVATLQHRKGQDTLLDQLDALIAAAPNLELYLVGAPVHDRAWADELRRRTAQHPVRARVHFMGGRDDALDFIYASDVLLLPSRAEAMPLVVLEAMALGTPVVADAVDGVPEMIADGHTGLLVNPSAPDGFAEALAKLHRVPGLAAELASGGGDRYRRLFSREKLIQRYAALVDEITLPAVASAQLGDCRCVHS